MNIIALFFKFIFMIMKFLIKFVISLLTFFFSFIIYLSSGYGKKSGNGFFKCKFDKGVKGEYELYKKLIKIFGKDKVLTNLYLPSTKIDTTEIDLIAIENSTIYCFEMKNYSGYIYGKEADENWTQVLNKNSKYKFYNPIKQNFAHKLALSDYLNIDKNKVTNCVIFSNKANLNKLSVTSKVIHLSELNEFLKENKTNLNISDKDIQTYIERLSKCQLASNKTKNEHINQIKETYHKE